jgi:PAS domain S-box-containing protein
MESQQTYAELADKMLGLTREQLEGLPWPVVRVTQQGVIAYANRRMLELAGVAEFEGANITDIFVGEDLATVRKHLESRFHSVADEYEVEFIRPRDRSKIPVRVSAFPEQDERGRPIGSFAILRDLSISRAAQSIHRHIEERCSGPEILREVAIECHKIVPFDLFSVTLISIDREHFRSFYLYPEDQLTIRTRWWPITPIGKKLLAKKQNINIDDIKKWIEEKDELRKYLNDPDVQVMLSQGYRSSLSIPVVRGDRAVASIGLTRKPKLGSFTKQDEERLGKLPLAAAVRMALHYDEVESLDFVLQLIRKITSVSDGVGQIAKIVVEEIANYFKWENVSIFRPDEFDGRICLVSQKYQKASFRLDENWSHPIEKGVTGQVFRTAQPVNVSDLKDPKYKDIYIEGYAESASEMCLPVTVQGRVYWLLNVEDSKKNAFAEEEMLAIQNIVRELTLVLERAAQHQIFTELLKRGKDVVIQTDFLGTILEVNPAAEEILGYSETEMIGSQLIQYFKDDEEARCIQEADYVPNDEVRLLRKDGAEARVLFSGTSLPRDIGRKVYVASDLSSRRRKETLEILRQMYNEIASQIKTPLSLAFTWLSKLRKSTQQPEISDLIDKTIMQLNRVDLAYDRLLLYERDKTLIPTDMRLFRFPKLLDTIIQRIPALETEMIQVHVDPDLSPVRGDIYQISLCLESILGYLLRFLPAAERIHIDVSSRPGRIAVSIKGYAPEVTGGEIMDYAETRWAIRAITEMALGEQMIKRFVEENHGGTFKSTAGLGERTEFIIEIPCA